MTEKHATNARSGTAATSATATTSRTHAQQAAEELFGRSASVRVLQATATIERHIAAALAEQEAEQWIDVREKLPKPLLSEFDGRFSDTVPMYDSRKNYWLGFYDFTEKRWWIHQGYEEDSPVLGAVTITHFRRALPAPPAGVKR